MSVSRTISLWRLFLIYTLIGLTGFGPTLAAETKKRLVRNEQWLTEEDFVNGLSLAQLLPGATFVNLTVYIGYKLRGISGALTAFFALLIMPFTLMIVLSHLYFAYHSIAAIGLLFKGVTVVIVGVMAHAVFEVGRSTVRDLASGVISVLGAGLMLYSGSPFVVLLVAAAAGIGVYYRSFDIQARLVTEASIGDKSDTELRAVRFWQIIAIGAISAIILSIAPVQPILIKLGWVFFQMGAVLFGGGLSMIPFIQQEVVSHYQWLTLEEFAVGIALGQVTPGPILIVATFVGYKVSAVSGAIAATLGIFLPSLFLVMATTELHGTIRNNSWVRSALKGIAASFAGMMVVVVLGLGTHSLTNIPSFIVAIAAFGVLWYDKLGTIGVIIAGTIGYWLLAMMGIMA